MSDRNHPYTNLPEQAFWKTAVAEFNSRQIDLAWKPKSLISRETKIITVGSCFAQHISKSLKENRFSWLDSEPAPTELSPTEHAKHGYGVFSFRTGNIYTAALLKQWIMWATGKAEQSTESFLSNGRYFDPFRPSLTVYGFSSAEEMLTARRTTLAAMLEAIKQADLFIFTLGLTEAWLNKDGSVYPMCPGTIQGTFSPVDHVFHNYNEQEVVCDLIETFDDLRRINPNLRFLLTVSPVPLTATASGQHVLTATTYSKSVLRSAAGYLTQTREDIDYFPSYELITAPAFKGQFFEPNMRSVSSDGVAFVMGQFLGSIETIAKPASPKTPVGTAASNNSEKTESETDICDDIILETWSNKSIDDSEEPPNILLIGDSQMGMIAKVLDEQGIRYAGGAIMHGSEWHSLKFTMLEDVPYFMPTIAEARSRWEEASVQSLLNAPEAARKNLFVITNIGAHANQIFSMNGIGSYMQTRYGTDIANGQRVNVTVDDLHNYLLSARAHHLVIINRLRKVGFNTIWISDPPVDLRNEGYYSLTDQILSEKYQAIDSLTFLAAKWISDRYGTLPSEFLSTEIDPSTGQFDVHHGSPEYYRQLMREIFSRFSIKPQHRTA
jgi:hypothetical protein